jgi:hypothetical protein
LPRVTAAPDLLTRNVMVALRPHQHSVLISLILSAIAKRAALPGKSLPWKSVRNP